MHGFGLMAGPFLGGLLYEIGGFYFPFAIYIPTELFSIFKISVKGDSSPQIFFVHFIHSETLEKYLRLFSI